ncbi:MAG TPA: high-affinity nickel-transport family protein [Candidatus Angelobacter sp.]|nr:high-affinity nickel-transport family protein [Candidatus Angelobacter sp.]
MHPSFVIVALGLFLGMRHASDPDHVIAIATIVGREKKTGIASLIGALWGVGHTVTLLLVGGAIILFKVVIPPGLGLAMELAVAVMLILLGVLNLTGAMHWINSALSKVPQQHIHTHGDYIHSHQSAESQGHGHAESQTRLGWLDRHLGRLGGGHLGAGRLGAYHFVRPIVIGVVHGLAGSAAAALLVLSTINDSRWALVYLLVFGVGTVLGMALITSVIAMPFAYTHKRHARLSQYLTAASGLASLGFGVLLVYQIGFVDGLFTNHVHWTPK